MILGADPHHEQDTNHRKPNQAQQVFDYFNFVARKNGANPVTDVKDRVAFLSHAKRSINHGTTVANLMEMTNRFFQFDRNREHRAPWKLFWTKDTQTKLMSENEDQTIGDPVLNWIGNDFCRTGDLPWSDIFDEEFRTMVHHTGMSVAYRYPDLLANIARISSGNTALAERMLVFAASLIEQCLHGNDDRELRSVLTDSGVTLPNDLKPKRVRREAMTLREAVIIASRIR